MKSKTVRRLVHVDEEDDAVGAGKGAAEMRDACVDTAEERLEGNDRGVAHGCKTRHPLGAARSPGNGGLLERRGLVELPATPLEVTSERPSGMRGTCRLDTRRHGLSTCLDYLEERPG